jgi:putative acetyltransferase
MIRSVEVSDYPRLIEIWEDSVSNTHDFLKEEDFHFYKRMLPSYFPHVKLFGYERNGSLIGFMGVTDDSIEMLFIENKHRGTGAGKEQVFYAIKNLHIQKVDVNEQNSQAAGLYKHIGFKVYGKSESDAEGKEYPILHMILK